MATHDKISILTVRMSELNSELYEKLVRSIKEANDNQTEILKSKIKLEIDAVKGEITEIKDIVRNEARKQDQIEKRQTVLESKYEGVQRTLKKNNIIIFGLETEKVKNVTEYTISKLNSLLQLKLSLSQIDNIYSIGKSTEKKPVVVRFISYLKKIEVLRECKKLKNSGVSISEDLTQKEREIRRILLKHKKVAQLQGQKAQIKKNLLYINGDAYTHVDLEKVTPEDQVINKKELRKINSAPPTPQAFRNTEYSETSDEEGEVFKIGAVLENKSINEDIVPENSPVAYANTGKGKQVETHTGGPITRKFRQNQQKDKPINQTPISKSIIQPSKVNTKSTSSGKGLKK